MGTDNIGFHPERRLDDGSLILRLVHERQLAAAAMLAASAGTKLRDYPARGRALRQRADPCAAR